MPRRVLDEETMLPLGLTIKWGAAIAGAYAAFAVLQFQVTQHSEVIARHEERDAKMLSLVTEIDKKVAVLLTKVEYLEKPVIRTRADVKTVKNAIFAGPVHRERFEACNAFGPFTMNGP
jgi:uncharacterized protein YlxW (UPF0749 family)